MRRASLALLATLATGCYTTSTLGGQGAQTAIAALVSGPHDRPINLRAAAQDGSTETVRIEPTTQVRFDMSNGGQTDWADVEDLSIGVDGLAILVPGDGQQAPQGAQVVSCGDGGMCFREYLPWSQVSQIEVKNFDGPESLFALVGGVELVLVVAVIIDEAGDDSGGDELLADLVDDAVDVGVQSAAANASGANSGDPPPEVMVDQESSGTVFSADAQRRSAATLFVTNESGVLTGEASGVLNTTGLGVELDELFDAQLTITAINPSSTLLPLGWRPQSANLPGWTYGYGGRFALDFPMDEGEHVFIPVGWEFGRYQNYGYYQALDAELAVHLDGDARLGVRPFNPEYVGGTHPGWGWLNQLTLSVAF
jgi:hypothetical protein